MSATTIGEGRAALPIAFAGFWRRIGAAILDSILLGLVGGALSVAAHDPLMQFGQQARFVGLPIALLYFGFFNSRYGGGGSPGKRALDIAVVRRDGRGIGLVRSLWRALVYLVPAYLNGFDLSFLPLDRMQMEVAAAADFVLVFGVFGGTVYLYLFNWSTRQVMHDLAAGTFVVRRADSAVEARINPAHLVVVAILLLAPVIALPAGLSYLGPKWEAALSRMTGTNFDALEKIQSAVNADPGVLSAGVTTNTTTFTHVNGPGTTVTALQVTVVTRGAVADPESFADRIAARALTVAPDALGEQVLTVEVRSGFDIGLWSEWSTRNYSHTPADWRARWPGMKAR